MSEGCCWYMVDSAPDGCAYLPGDVVTLPCTQPCESREVTEPGPCQGMILVALDTNCLPCEGGLTAAAVDAARSAKRGASSKGRPLSGPELRGLRKASL